MVFTVLCPWQQLALRSFYRLLEYLNLAGFFSPNFCFEIWRAFEFGGLFFQHSSPAGPVDGAGALAVVAVQVNLAPLLNQVPVHNHKIKI